MILQRFKAAFPSNATSPHRQPVCLRPGRSLGRSGGGPLLHKVGSSILQTLIFVSGVGPALPSGRPAKCPMSIPRATMILSRTGGSLPPMPSQKVL